MPDIPPYMKNKKEMVIFVHNNFIFTLSIKKPHNCQSSLCKRSGTMHLTP